MADPNLRTPYVQQWNIGVQREMKGIVLDARYVGNHGTKLLRAIDMNQININADTYPLTAVYVGDADYRLVSLQHVRSLVRGEIRRGLRDSQDIRTPRKGFEVSGCHAAILRFANVGI